MAVTRLTCSKKDGVSIELPKGFSRISIPSLNINEDYTGTYIQGFVSERWAVVDRKKLPNLLKFILDEKNDQSKPATKQAISVFCFGDLTKDMDQLTKGDLVIISGFQIEQATRSDPDHPCQLSLSHEENNVQIWIVNVSSNPEPNPTVTAATSGDKRKANFPDYVYTPLNSLQPSPCVNVFAVVKFCKAPYKTRGTDLCQVLSIVDPSCAPEVKLKCLLFFRPPVEAPPVQVGSIIRFHRLKVIHHNGELQGNTGPGFSWLVFEASEGASLTPISSSPKFSITDTDKQRVEELRRWITKQDTFLETINHISLSDILPGKYCNVFVQVVSTCPVETGTCFVLRVWDGTKSIYPVREYEKETESSDWHIDQPLMETAEGFLYDVALFDNHFKTGTTIKPGDFIELRNLHAAIYRNTETRDEYNALQTVELVIHYGTAYGRGVTKIASDNHRLSSLIQRLDKIKDTVRKVLNSNKNVPPGNINGLSCTGEKARTAGTQNPSNPEDVTEMDDNDSIHPRLTSTPCLPVNSDRVGKPSDVTHCGRKRVCEPNQSTIHSTAMELNMESPVKSPKQSEKNITKELNVEKEPGTSATTGSGSMDTSTNQKEHSVPTEENNTSTTADVNPDSSHELVLSCDPNCSPPSPVIDRCMMETATVITAHHHIEPVSLCEVIKHSVPYKFRIRVRLKAYEPKVDFVQLYCQYCHYLTSPSFLESSHNEMVCPKCLEASELLLEDIPVLEYTYMMKLLLEEGGDCIEANLWRCHATEFFRGVSPKDAISDKSTLNTIMEDMTTLMGTDQSKPWLECCIKSYTGQSGTCYQIFDTSIV